MRYSKTLRTGESSIHALLIQSSDETWILPLEQVPLLYPNLLSPRLPSLRLRKSAPGHLRRVPRASPTLSRHQGRSPGRVPHRPRLRGRARIWRGC